MCNFMNNSFNIYTIFSQYWFGSTDLHQIVLVIMWPNFTIKEIRRFIGLLILNGLSVSPRLEYKFKTQDQDPVNGNNLCAGVFGTNAGQRLKEFRSVFAIQDPMVPIPERKKAPNHKVDPLLRHMQRIFLECWECGFQIAGDEQDAGFKGRHPDK